MAGLKHVPTLNLAVGRFYQAEPELRQGKGELFLWKGYKNRIFDKKLCCLLFWGLLAMFITILQNSSQMLLKKKNHSSKIFLPILYFLKWKFRCWLASLVLPLVWFISLALVIHSLNINTIFNQHHQQIGWYHPQYFPKVSFWCWD